MTSNAGSIPAPSTGNKPRRDTMSKHLEEEWNEHLCKIAERNEKERQSLIKDLGVSNARKLRY